MKRKSPIAVLAGWLALAVAPTPSAQAASAETNVAGAPTATISGRIQNAATGANLQNVRVAIKGTNLVAFTDETGRYILTRVPSGAIVLETYYAGLDSEDIALTVSPGAAVERDIVLTNRSRYGDAKVVKLDPFEVSSARQLEGEALATNEQRYAPNIKNVVATDAYGDITEGNVSEFLKFVPGVTQYDSNVSVRGFGTNHTMVSVDGAQMANAAGVGNSREFSFHQVSINNTSRIEITKVPTPATRADSMAGTINMVSKSAFERESMQFKYRVYLTGNSGELRLKRTPYSYEERTYKVLPNFDFDLTLPVNPNFGIVLTALSSSTYPLGNLATMTWRGDAANTGATPARPYLQSFQIIDQPNYKHRKSISAKADWRVAPNSVLSFGTTVSYYNDDNGNYNITFNAGTNGLPTPATGMRMSYGEDHTIGATGRGGITQGTNFLNIAAATVSENLRYRFDNGHWRIEAAGTYSTSRTWRRALQHGHFQNLATSFNRPIRVEFHQITPQKPGIIRAYDNNNREVDISDVSNYVINTGGIPSYGDVREKIGSAELNVRRQLDVLPFPAAVQMGGAYRRQERDIKLENQTWTFNGIGGNRSAAPFAAILFDQRANYYGFYDLPWISPDRAVAAWKSDPSLFTKTAANIVSEESFRRTRSEYLKEDTSALYFQLEAKLLRNRLRLVTGARYETTTDNGLGPLVEPGAVWVRNPDGTFARNSAGNRIRRPEAGTAGSLQQLDLTTHERGTRAKRSYDGYYPSLHVTYNLAENLLVRAAYAKSYARPDLDSVIPNTVVDEFDLDVGAADPSLLQGSVTLRNTGIKPWTADNYDVSLEYYTDTGGVFTVGGFQKEIKDFFGAIRRPATQADIDALGLDPQYLGWELRTEFNAGDARISGLEFSIRHSLAKLGRWGKYFDGFVNGTKLNLEGDQDADFRDFMPEILNWGITFSRNPVTFMAKWHSRGTRSNSGATAVAPDGFVYDKGYTTVDLNFTYQLGRRHSLFVNVRNVAEVAPIIQRYGSATPPHARQFRSTQRGAIISAGIRGTF